MTALSHFYVVLQMVLQTIWRCPKNTGEFGNRSSSKKATEEYLLKTMEGVKLREKSS